jgi:hypothetical protein
MTGDNCPHVPVDMLHGWRILGRGRDWDVGGVAEVDHDERPEWDVGPNWGGWRYDGGDCEDGAAPAEPDRTGWPADGSRWEHLTRVTTWQAGHHPSGRRWRLLAMSYEVADGDWTAEPIDLTVWRPL